MYGMVLMVAVTGSGDAASFGKRGGGCNGDVVSSCSGNGCDGGRDRGGFLGLRNRGGCDGGCDGGGCNGRRDRGGFLGHRNKGGCDGGGCNGSYVGGCTGVVVAAPAPVVVAAPVAAPCVTACAPVCAPACDPCESKKREGLFSRLCGKKKNKGCDTCAAPACAAPACNTCATAGPIVVAPATPNVPVTMPPVTGKKE